jgi:hypothetical protein
VIEDLDGSFEVVHWTSGGRMLEEPEEVAVTPPRNVAVAAAGSMLAAADAGNVIGNAALNGGRGRS